MAVCDLYKGERLPTVNGTGKWTVMHDAVLEGNANFPCDLETAVETKLACMKVPLGLSAVECAAHGGLVPGAMTFVTFHCACLR